MIVQVKGVRTSSRLVDSPAMIVGHQSAAERRLHQMQMQMVAGHKDAAGLGINFDAMGPVGTLEINPAHPILKCGTSRISQSVTLDSGMLYAVSSSSKFCSRSMFVYVIHSLHLFLFC